MSTSQKDPAILSTKKQLTYTQYRLSWLREGNKPKHKKYRSMKPVNRMLALLTSPEPWVVIGRDPDDRMCCSGYECACSGQTVRDEMLARREGLPPILWTKVAKRTVTQTAWEETP
jgi:hypothetical protein